MRVLFLTGQQTLQLEAHANLGQPSIDPPKKVDEPRPENHHVNA